MRDIRDAKAMAKTLRASLAAMGVRITVSQSLELIAQAFGVADWNALAAAIRPEAIDTPQLPLQPSPPSDATPTTPPAGVTKQPGPLASGLVVTLQKMFDYAKSRRHESVTAEHLLLFLLDDPDAAAVTAACGVDAALLRRKLRDHLDDELSAQPLADGDKPSPTLGFQRVLQRAVYHVHTSGMYPVTGANVLVAVFSEKTSRAVQLLSEQGMTRPDAVNFIAHGIKKGTSP